MRKKLTDSVVKSTKPPASGRIEIWDRLLPSFGVRITDKDARTYFVMYRVGVGAGRRLRRLKIGNADAMTLAAAREDAREKLRQVAAGIDPAGVLRQSDGDLLRTVADAYLRQHAQKNTRESTWTETKRIFESEVLPAWGDRKIADIAKRDVERLLDKIVDRGAEIQANRTLAKVRALFNWAVKKDYLDASPADRVMAPAKERPRDRILSDDEIRWFWAACDEIGYPYGPLFQLLLLTAQRRDEVGGLEQPELDLAHTLWTIPRHKAKNDRTHDVHLSPRAVDIIKVLPRISGSPLLFTSSGKTAVTGFSRAKDKLDAVMERIRRRELGLPEDDDAQATEIEPWILHDLRRTAATGMARLNIPPHVVDRILNHVSGTIRGVAAIYNRFGYVEERKAALDAWTRHVELVVRPSTRTVEVAHA